MDHKDLSLADLQAQDPKPFRSGGQLRFLCPFCGIAKHRDNVHRSLAVNPDTGAWICHRCSISGLLKEFRSRQQPPAERKLVRCNERSGLVITQEADNARKTDKLNSQLRRVEPKLEGTPAGEYLLHRGIPACFGHLCGARFAPNWGHTNESPGYPSVVFPIYDVSGKLVAATGRAITCDRKITYGAKKLGVFATPNAFLESVVAITEAPIDAITLALCGIPSIALAGTASPDWLPEKLGLKYVLIATDSDQAGDTAAGQLRQALGSFCKCYRLRPSKGDWNDVLRSLGFTTLKGKIDDQLQHMGIPWSCPDGQDQ